MDPKRVLFTFLSVYKHGSQTQAAQQLFLTQPAVSQHIKWLESQLNQSLFIKEGRSLKPTMAAEHLASRLYKHVEAIDGIWRSIKQPMDTRTPVHFGTVPEFFSVVFAPHLYQLTDRHIQLIQQRVHPHELEMLQSGQIDVAHLFGYVSVPGIELVPFFREDFCLIGDKRYFEDLKSHKKDFLEKLWRLPWVTYDESLLFIKDYCQQVFNAPFQGHVAHQLPDIRCILEAVMHGAGVTVLPTFYCKHALSQKKLYRLHAPKEVPTIDFYLAWREGSKENPAISQTIDFLLKAAQSLSLPI